VQAVLPAIITDPMLSKVFLCGSPAMLADTKKLCIETLQMPKANVHGEGYI
jgi:ferredoxin-NADP reductase